MTHYLGGAVVTIECTECGNHIQETAAHIQAHGHLRCSDCSARVAVDDEELKSALEQFAIAYNAFWTNGGISPDQQLQYLPSLVTH